MNVLILRKREREGLREEVTVTAVGKGGDDVADTSSGGGRPSGVAYT